MSAITATMVFALTAGADVERVNYVRDIKPILSHRCVSCHGALKQESGLRVDTAGLLKKGGEGGPGFVAKAPQKSRIIDALREKNGLSRMPMEGKPLSEEEIDLIAKWIEEGADAPAEAIPADPKEHWAFKTPVRPSPPKVKRAEWVKNPVDAFIAAEHEKKGLSPNPPAAPHVLLRRVHLDLVGLPPTREELAAFLADPSAAAYARVVDGLLSSPQYGERWGRHWMDVWRYSDWYGWAAEVRNSQKHIWRWRDWIVESLNQDKPYDQMVREMLAGDEIAPTDPNVIRATGYLARNWYLFNRNTWINDAVEHTGKAFLGLTFNCARCHDHMYDPIEQTDYYKMRAFFEPHGVRIDPFKGTIDLNADGVARVYDSNLEAVTHLFERGDEHRPKKDAPIIAGLPKLFGDPVMKTTPVSLPAKAYYAGVDPEYRKALLDVANTEVTEASLAIGKLKDDKSPAMTVAKASLAAAKDKRTSLLLRIAADDAKFAEPPAAHAKELAREAAKAERAAAVSHLVAEIAAAEVKPSAGKAKPKGPGIDELKKKLEQAKGNLSKESNEYTPVSTVYPSKSSGRRLALANWITERKNPLTARVAVNHLWMRHFGKPLVQTVFDFGRNGKPPTHPALLDWLAVELMDRGWSMKKLHRTLVLSSAYKMGSSLGPGAEANLRLDPDNRYLWRMTSHRMEAEVIRDSLLATSGALDPARGGPEIDPNLGESVPRRSIYFRHAPEKQVVFLMQFDVAGTAECYQRPETVAPQQALALSNSRLARTQARRLAKLLTDETRSSGSAPIWSDQAFVTAAFQRILCRPPAKAELDECVSFLSRQASRLIAPASLSAFDGETIESAPSSEPNARARENLVHVLFNHGDFVTVW